MRIVPVMHWSGRRLGRVRSAAAVLAMVGGLASVGVKPAGVAPIAPTAWASVVAAAVKPVTRLAGADRIGTAIAISQETFPNPRSAGAVVLTDADNFPDALAGAPLAAAKQAPVLLTDPGGLSSATLTEIVRVAPPASTVYVLGGPFAISTTVDAELRFAGYAPQRIAGTDRFATSVAIANVLGSPSTVLLASGDVYADALSAGPAAASAHGAVLLTDGTNLPSSVVFYLARVGSATVYDIGDAAGQAYPGGTKVSGGDRFATSAAVAARFFLDPSIVGVATGYNFPDALSGAGAMAVAGGPILLSDPLLLPLGVAQYLSTWSSSITQALLFGGELSLSPAIANTVSSEIG
jgi:hypothetical protein